MRQNTDITLTHLDDFDVSPSPLIGRPVIRVRTYGEAGGLALTFESERDLARLEAAIARYLARKIIPLRQTETV